MTSLSAQIAAQRLRSRETLERTFADFLNGDRSGRIFYQGDLHTDQLPNKTSVESFDDALSRRSHYYIFPNEVRLIRDAAAEIAATAGYRPLVVELGTGSQRAVEHKTLPLVAAMKPQRYVANDLCEQSVRTAQGFVQHAFPFVEAEACRADFLDEGSPLFACRDANVLMLGSTISNLPSWDGHLPANELVSCLRTVGRLLGEKGNLIITQDANQDEASLLDCYRTPIIVRYLKDMLHRFKHCLALDTFDPTVMQFEPLWDAKNHLLSATFVNVKDQTVKVGNDNIFIPEGRRLYIANCYKYPVESFLHLSGIAGLSPVRTWMDADNRVALHVLRKTARGARPLVSLPGKTR
jgi:L-histidine N-alpha-methyltransferase